VVESGEEEELKWAVGEGTWTKNGKLSTKRISWARTTMKPGEPGEPGISGELREPGEPGEPGEPVELCGSGQKTLPNVL